MNKKIIVTIIAVIIVLVVGYAVTKKSKAPTTIETQNTTEQSSSLKAVEGTHTYAINPEKSSFEWTGKKTLIKDYFDTGIVKVKEGNAEVKDGKLTGGTIVMDLTTINASKTGKGAGEDMLSKHLMSADFFDVEKYPTAKFVITAAIPNTVTDTSHTEYTVQGDLTIKDKTNTISFPATLSTDSDGNAVLEAMFELDRTKWDVRYGSTSFFKDLGDNVIDNNFTAKLKIVGTPNN